MENNAERLFYLMLPKRYLSRYVLTYEILPLECCHDINGCKVFDGTTLKTMLAQKKISDKNVIIALNEKSNDLFQSYTNIKKIGFPTKESLESFTDISYENYDLSTINFCVMDIPYENDHTIIDIAEPAVIDKYSFSQRVALKDAITVAVHKTLIAHPQCSEKIFKYNGDAEALLSHIISFYIGDSSYQQIAIAFFKICSEFHVTHGWQQEEIISKFGKMLENSTVMQDAVNIWISTARKLINNAEITLCYSDDSNVVLRAMTLVFLNPEQKNIDNMKLYLGEKMGQKVFALADLFISARTGYSYLNTEQRKQINCRKELHNLSASLYNSVSEDENKMLDISLIEEKFTNPEASRDSLEQALWLTNHTGNSFKLYGVKPMAGFDLTLEYIPDSILAWRIIDANSEKGMDKLKGQLAINLISIQKDFPEGARIEIVDNKGLYIMLPVHWAINSDLKDKMSLILNLLSSIKVAQKSSLIKNNLSR